MVLLKKYILSVFNIVLLLGFLFIPLYFNPKEVIQYEIPKVYLFQRWVEILVFLALLVIVFTLKKSSKKLSTLIYITLFTIWSFISSLFGANFIKSLAGNYYRSDGLITFFHIILLFLIMTLLLSNNFKLKLIKTISISSIILGGWVIVDSLRFYILKDSGLNIWESNAFGGPFGNPNFLAGYLLSTLPITYYQIEEPNTKVKTLFKIGILFQSLGLILTRSWTGLFGLLLLFLIYLVFIKSKYKKLLLATASITFIATAFLFIKNYKSIQIPDRIIAESRERIFTKGLLAFTKKPIVGWGWANFDHAFDSVDWPIKFNTDAYVDKAHSSLLEVLVTTGVVGGILYMLIITNAIKSLVESKNRLAKFILLSLLITLIHMQTNVISISEDIFFWTLISFS